MRAKQRRNKLLLLLGVMVLLLTLSGCGAVDNEGNIVGGLLGSSRSDSVNILMLLTVLSLAPSILIMVTAFTRIIIVLSLTRNGMGLQNMPPNQVMIGLALFLTFFVMQPVVNDINANAYQPYIAEEIDGQEAVSRAMVPLREFMFKNTNKSDMEFFANASDTSYDAEDPEGSVSTVALIPAFITSEIKRGMLIGLFIYIPFIVIDMVVASTLMAMGMMMLPPVVISLPFKLLLFVLVDGWSLVIQSLITTFT